MKIFKWIILVIIIALLLLAIFVPKEKYSTNPDNSPYIGGNPSCLGLSIPLSCTTYACDNLCIGKVVMYGVLPPK